MSILLTHKPLGVRMTKFRVKGLAIAQSHRVFGDHSVVLRVYLTLPNYEERYIFHLQHLEKRKLVEAICLRDGHGGKAAVIEAIRCVVLAGETDLKVKEAVDQLRAEVIAEVQRFRPFPSEMEMAFGRNQRD